MTDQPTDSAPTDAATDAAPTDNTTPDDPADRVSKTQPSERVLDPSAPGAALLDDSLDPVEPNEPG